MFLQTIIALASASLGLVAALPWSDAIKATVQKIAGDDSLAGVYPYAILATVLAVVVLVALGRPASRNAGEAAFLREAEG